MGRKFRCIDDDFGALNAFGWTGLRMAREWSKFQHDPLIRFSLGRCAVPGPATEPGRSRGRTGDKWFGGFREAKVARKPA